MNSLLHTNRLILLIFLITGSVHALSQPVIEHTDSTIAQIVYPDKDLKLWYGSDDFRVSNFVILPNYTLLYNNELSIVRLLGNKENLVKDEVRLLSIKSIKPYNVNDKKWALGPSTTWFKVLTDSTLLVGTALFKGRNEVAGYLLVTIRNERLIIDHKPFDLDSKTDAIEPNNMQFIADYTDYKGAQLYSSMFVLAPTPKNELVVKKSLYLKTAQKPLSLYFSKEEDPQVPVEKRQMIPVQLITTDERLLIYDPETEQLRVVTTDIANPMLLDLASALPDNVPKGRKFGRAFMVDRVSKQLYYKTLAFSKEGTDQMVMSVTLGVGKITVEPILRSNMIDYYSMYINNRKLFFYDSKKGYIYVTKADLP